jgi:hypothetical protein
MANGWTGPAAQGSPDDREVMQKVLLAAMGSDESNDAREHTFRFH